ncbi:MAG: peptide chain release factor N(5)-glutamine methyltransferase [Ginsengibacter sp.]
MTLQDYFNYFKKELEQIYSTSESENITDWVFESVTGLKRGDRLLRKSDNLSEKDTTQLRDALTRLKDHEPIQYVLGESWFYKEKFRVSRDVLIPRPETEELISWALSEISKDDKLDILDIGTGSGCIPIIMKKYLPKSIVKSIDISEKAINVAKDNARQLNVDVEFICTNFINDSNWSTMGQYDVIISNPPYIPISEVRTLRKNVTDYEPGLALFVEDSYPLLFYKKIIDFSILHLYKSGKIFVEIHEDHAVNTLNLFEVYEFAKVEIRNDIYGKERMIMAVK